MAAIRHNIRFTRADLEAKAAHRPPGYVALVLSVASQDGDHLTLTAAQHAAIAAWTGGPPPILKRMAAAGATLMQAARKLVTTGRLRADKRLVAARLARCSACPLNKAQWCQACGCYLPAKAALADQFCPMNLWIHIMPA